MRIVNFVLLALAFHASAQGRSMCAGEFVKFLGDFERSKAVQATHTNFPLRYSHVDHDDPELKQKHIWLNKQSVEKFESFPSPEYQAKIKLERKITKDEAGRCAVNFNVPDSDMYAMTFSFIKWGNAWRLVEIEDNSL